jgi:hypothetical protein
MGNFTADPAIATVRIHSRIVDGASLRDSERGGLGQSAVYLWYLVRLLDARGSGCAEYKIQEFAEKLKRSVGTIRRYIYHGLKLRLFQRVEKRGDRIRVVYSSLFKVCAAWGIDNWGAVTEVGLEDLQNGALKLIATQAEVQRLQDSSRRSAVREHRKGVAHPNELIDPPSQCSRGTRGSIIHQGARMTFVDSEFIPFGVSQQGVAAAISRGDRTIRNRLSNQNRERYGLPRLARTQIAQTSETLDDRFGWLLSHIERSEIKQMDLIWATEFSNRIFSCCGRVFKAICNIYSKDLILNSMRRSRSLFNKFRSSLVSRSSDSELERNISRV